MSGEVVRDLLFGQAPHETRAEGSSTTQPDGSSDASEGVSRSEAPSATEMPPQEALSNLQRTLERFASGIVPSQELGGDTLASAAQQHRLAANMGVDLPAVATWCEKALPFLLLLLCTFIYRHIQGIATYIWLNMILAKANEMLRKQVALKQDCSKRQCVSLAALMGMHVAFILLLFRRQELWLQFALLGTASVPTVWEVFFRVSIADVLVRFWGIAWKCMVLVVHAAGSRGELRKRSQVLTVLEQALIFVRHLLPTPLWYAYLTNGATKSGMLSASTAIVYMVLKVGLVWEKGQLLVVSAKALAQAQSSYGKAVSPAELCEIGGTCSICQEAFTRPLMLSCKHVFCEACISEWHQREQRTCPMCRAVVQPPGMNLHTDGGTQLLPCLF